MLLPQVPHGNSPAQYLDVSSTWQLGILPLLSCPILYYVGLSTFGDGIYGATVIIYLLIVRTLSMWSDVSIYLWMIYRYYCTLLGMISWYTVDSFQRHSGSHVFSHGPNCSQPSYPVPTKQGREELGSLATAYAYPIWWCLVLTWPTYP